MISIGNKDVDFLIDYVKRLIDIAEVESTRDANLIRLTKVLMKRIEKKQLKNKSKQNG